MIGRPIQAARLPQLRARALDRKAELPDSIKDLLPKRLQAKLRNIATILEYGRAGSPVFCEGEDAHFVYIVGSGIVRVTRLSEIGRRQVLAFMFAGDIFGLPDGGVYVNSTEAIIPSTLYRIPWSPLSALMRQEPEMQAAFFTRIAFDFRQAQRRIMVLAQQNASQKLASFLLDLYQYPEFRNGNKDCLELPLTRVDLGDYLGITKETVARAFAKMEAAKVLKRSSTYVLKISDIATLRTLAAGPRRGPNKNDKGRPRNALR